MSSMLSERYRILEATTTAADVTVYAAEDGVDGRPVELTVLRGEAAADAEFVKAVTDQVRRLTKSEFAHPSLVRVYESGTTDDGVLYVAHQPVAGRALRDVLDERGVLGVDEGLSLAIQIGEALEMLHLAGVVHGELSPECIYLVERPTGHTVKLGGVHLTSARRTRLGRRLRNAALMPYLAPEQVEFYDTAEAADIHALGLLTREMITGQGPRSGSPPHSRVSSLPPSLVRIVGKALERSPGRRYADVSLMVNELWTAASAAPKPAALPVGVAALERRSTSGRRARSDAGIVTALILGVLMLVVTGWVITSERFAGTRHVERSARQVVSHRPSTPTGDEGTASAQPGSAAVVQPAAAPASTPAPPVIEQRAVPPVQRPAPTATRSDPAVVERPAPPPAPSAALRAVELPPAMKPSESSRSRLPPAMSSRPLRYSERAVPTADDPSDGMAIIDWLLKKERPRD